MSRVVMVHPTIPDREIEVPEASVFGHRASGWITKEEADALPPRETPTKARVEPEPPNPAATSRRVTSPSGTDKE